jgi:hypothetical protein
MGDPAGAKAPRRLPSLPEESKFLQRKSTVYNQKQQSLRKQPIDSRRLLLGASLFFLKEVN